MAAPVDSATRKHTPLFPCVTTKDVAEAGFTVAHPAVAFRLTDDAGTDVKVTVADARFTSGQSPIHGGKLIWPVCIPGANDAVHVYERDGAGVAAVLVGGTLAVEPPPEHDPRPIAAMMSP